MATIHITNAAQLQDMSSDLSADYVLDNDVNLYGITWSPVGTLVSPFTGTFDGGGFRIKNLTYVGSSGVGIFGYATGASFSNVKLENFTLQGLEYVGALVGCMTGGSASNCKTQGGTIIGTATLVDPAGDVGGLIGCTLGGVTLTSCTASCTVSGAYDIGGLIGSIKNIDGTAISHSAISSCWSTGVVTGEEQLGYASSGIGGMIGLAYLHNGTNIDTSSITGCFANGDVSGNNSVGGFIGKVTVAHSNVVTISSCYSRGDVSGVAQGSGTESQKIGGFIGWGTQPISNCYSVGNVSSEGSTSDYGSYDVGGFAGWGENITWSYSTGDVTAGAGAVAGANSGAKEIGGFIGETYTSISGCYSHGDVTAASGPLLDIANASTDIGGFVGWIQTGAGVYHSYATGSVLGSQNVGGFAGYNMGTITNSFSRGAMASGVYYTGGFIGKNAGPLVKKCYTSEGAVMGDAGVGGFIGSQHDDAGCSMINSFASCPVTGNTLVGGFIGNEYA